MKGGLEDLAVLGGSPAFAEPLHVGHPHVGSVEALTARLREALDRRRLTNHGPFVEELEGRLAEYLGVGHCVATCNGTTALQLAARAAGLEGEVIVPAFTFVATAHAISWLGLRPIPCDVDPRTHHLDPAAVERLIGNRTSGIVAVHLWGRPCAIEELEPLAAEHGLRLIFDAAHAFACSHRGRMIGSFGDAEVLSMHATKVLNGFEGGAVTTDDGDLAEAVRLMSNFGFQDYDRVVSLGTNGKMSEASAAMALVSLESLDRFIEVNAANEHAYATELGELPGIELLSEDTADRRNHHHVVVEVDSATAGLTRDQLHALLWAENVLARRYFHPGIHRMEPYAAAGEPLPVAERLAERTLVLPNGGLTTPEDVKGVCELIRFAVGHGEEIRGRLAAR